MGQIIVVGIGPGSLEDISPAVIEALKNSDVVIGYSYYFQFITDFLKPSTECIDTGMKKENARAELAFKMAEQDKIVTVISSGDAGIYGMAPLICQMKEEINSDIQITVLPGISAFQKAASLLGAPVGHDFCVISMSDLMTPWEKIENRIIAAAKADFVTAIYNPKSEGRYWQLARLKELFLLDREANTPVGYVRNAGREDQCVKVTTLDAFNIEDVDMFTVVIIGNSQSYISKASQNTIITPRGYFEKEPRKTANDKIGQSIMIKSFKTIESSLKNPNIALGKKWAMLHAIHTTADFQMEEILYTDENAVEELYKNIAEGNVKTIITDVTMVVSGVRKAALERFGVEIKCYLHDERVPQMAQDRNITRTQAGIRIAVAEHPEAIFIFGNAPTALIELCSLIRKGKATPMGVIAAPVGFVNVRESKYMIKSFKETKKIIVEGRKGGSNIAATLMNSILSFEDAGQMLPGRDV